jgi:hypothetical protein
MIVTCNLDDFPVTALAPYGVKAMHPDEFVAGLFGVFPDSVLAALSRQRSFLQKPPKSVDQFLDAFVQMGLLKTVELVKPHSKSL